MTDSKTSDFNKVDLNLLRVFQAIGAHKSLTLAGQQLGLSQPAISYSLGRLRALFDDPLFIRSNQGMQPTPAAEELAKPIERALESIQEALRYADRFNPAASTRTFRISMSDIGEMGFLPPLCEKMRALAPNMRLEIGQVPLVQVEEALRNGRLDFAIGNLPTLKPVTFSELLFHEAYVCMTRKRAGLPRKKTLLLEEFLALTHIFVVSVENSHRMVEDALRALGIHRKIALDIPHFSVVPEILQRTDLAVTLPVRVARSFNANGEFAIYTLPVPIPEVEVTVHWHESFQRDEGNRWLRKLIIDTLKE